MLHEIVEALQDQIEVYHSDADGCRQTSFLQDSAEAAHLQRRCVEDVGHTLADIFKSEYYMLKNPDYSSIDHLPFACIRLQNLSALFGA